MAIIGAGEVGSQIARAAIASGCHLISANSGAPTADWQGVLIRRLPVFTIVLLLTGAAIGWSWITEVDLQCWLVCLQNHQNWTRELENSRLHSSHQMLEPNT